MVGMLVGGVCDTVERFLGRFMRIVCDKRCTEVWLLSLLLPFL
jgi:hypothetical protein